MVIRSEIMLHTIYKITNKITGKSYIGYTSKTIQHRFKQHCADTRKTILHDAIRGYRPENFVIEAIYQSSDGEYTRNMEPVFIKEYDTIENGYNMSQGGAGNPICGEMNGMYGRKHSEETKEKIRRRAIGRKLSEETKNKMRGPRPSFAGTKHPMYGKIGPLNPMFGRKLSEETKAKLRGPRPCISGDNNPSKKVEVKEKIRQSKLGKKRPFTRRRVRNAEGVLVWKEQL